MSPPAGPFARCAPALIAGQPVHRPGPGVLGDSIAKLPFPFAWIVQAQDRMLRIDKIREMMRDGFIRVLRAAHKQRVKDCNLWHCRQYLGRTEIASEAVKHLDEIALVEGAEPSLPGNQPARLAADLKARPNLSH